MRECIKWLIFFLNLLAVFLNSYCEPLFLASVVLPFLKEQQDFNLNLSNEGRSISHLFCVVTHWLTQSYLYMLILQLKLSLLPGSKVRLNATDRLFFFFFLTKSFKLYLLISAFLKADLEMEIWNVLPFKSCYPELSWNFSGGGGKKKGAYLLKCSTVLP